jgi:hypothetical protein
MADPDPFRDQPPPRPDSGGGPLPNLGDYLGRGLRVYGERWQDWLVPILVAGAVMVAGWLCCLGNFLVAGPLACGLYCCGLCALRGRPFSAGTLWRDWTVAGRAILAHLVILLLTSLPILLIYAASFTAFALLMATLGSLSSGQPQGGPSDEAAIAVVLGFIATALVFTLGILAAMVWALWLGTKAMFVLPLIADRQVDFLTAWRMSWAETRRHFWELFLLKFLAGLIGMAGMYAMYVGLIFTLPMYFTMIAAAYEHRFPFPVEPLEATGPGDRQAESEEW